MIGLACIASMFVGLTSLLACCMRDLVTRKVGKVCGAIQFVAGKILNSFVYFQFSMLIAIKSMHMFLFIHINQILAILNILKKPYKSRGKI